MLFSGSTLPPSPSLHRLFSLHCHHFFLSFLPLSSKNVFPTLLWDYVIWEENTHIQTDEDLHRKKNMATHTHTHISGHRGRGWTFDSGEMVDLLMAVTVRRHGWFTWTQPHLSLSRRFLPLYRRQMFTGSYQPPKTTFRRAFARKTQEEMARKMWEPTVVRKQEIIARLTDWQWEILYVEKKEITAADSFPELK